MKLLDNRLIALGTIGGALLTAAGMVFNDTNQDITALRGHPPGFGQHGEGLAHPGR